MKLLIALNKSTDIMAIYHRCVLVTARILYFVEQYRRNKDTKGLRHDMLNWFNHNLWLSINAYTYLHIRIFIFHHKCLLTFFVSYLEIKALTDHYIDCVNYGDVFILNDLLYLISGGKTKKDKAKKLLPFLNWQQIVQIVKSTKSTIYYDAIMTSA